MVVIVWRTWNGYYVMYSIIVMCLHLFDLVVNVGFDQTYIIVCFMYSFSYANFDVGYFLVVRGLLMRRFTNLALAKVDIIYIVTGGCEHRRQFLLQ